MKPKRNICLVLLMILCLFSCTFPPFDDSPIELKESKTITVRMRLPGSGTRASVDAPVSKIIVVITVVDIYFYNRDKGVIYNKISLDSMEINQISTGDGLIFIDLDPNIDGVAIVTNNNENKNLSVTDGQSIYDLFTLQVNIKYEQDFSDVTLYGKSETLIRLNPANTSNIDYFSINVIVNPFVARIEINEIACVEMDVDGFNRHFRLHAVLIENICDKVVLDTRAPVSSTLFLADKATVESHPSYWWIYSYTSDYPFIPNNDPNNTFSPDVNDPTQDGDGVFAFHFIPSGELWMRLYMESTYAKVPSYLNIRDFEKIETKVFVGFLPGYIYKMKIPFKEDDVTIFADESNKVTVNVEIQSWAIVNGIIPKAWIY